MGHWSYISAITKESLKSIDPLAFWTMHEDVALVSAAVRVDAEGYFI